MELGIALAAAAATVVSAVFVLLQVGEMRRQTALQREIAESSSAPYVWADVRIQSANGWNVELVLGNSGSTIATDVVVLIDPPFPSLDKRESRFVDAMHEKLAAGVACLVPGKTMSWTLGPGPDLVNREGSLAHTITIDCNGPFGKVPRNQYVIDMSSFRESVARHSGTLRDISKAIEKAADRIADATT